MDTREKLLQTIEKINKKIKEIERKKLKKNQCQIQLTFIT